MDDLIVWDDLKRELIAVLAGVVYLAAVRLIQRYKGVLDRWLKPADEVPIPAPDKAEQKDDQEADTWLDGVKDPEVPPER